MVEIIPKQTVKFSLRTYVLFYVGLGFFALSVVGFFVIQQLTSILTSELEVLEQRLQDATTSEERELEQSIFASKAKIDDFSRIITKRKDTRRVLSFLETYTHPEVAFGKFTYVAETGTVSLPGIGTSFYILEQQMLVLENLPEISELSLDSVALADSGRASFKLRIIFTEEALEQIFVTEKEDLEDEEFIE